MSYRKQDYRSAVDHFDSYRQTALANKEELVRNDLFMLGMAQYRLGNYQAA